MRIIAAGKVSSGFSILKLIALGADACYSARSMMIALGCIQALKCNSNHCPVGVATQDKQPEAGLVPSDKKVRVASYHRETTTSFAEILGAIGLEGSSKLRPWHVMHRVSSTETKQYGEMYQYLSEGDLLGQEVPESYLRAWELAESGSFEST